MEPTQSFLPPCAEKQKPRGHAGATGDTTSTGKTQRMSTKTSAEGIQNNNIQTGGANTKIIVDGADAVGSFVTRSTVLSNKAVPPDGPRQMYRFLQMSASYSMLKWRGQVVDCTGIIHRKWEKRFRAGTFTHVGATLENSTWMEPTRRCFQDARETIGKHVLPPITRHWRSTLQETGQKCRGSAAS